MSRASWKFRIAFRFPLAARAIFTLLIALAFSSRLSFAAEAFPGEPNVAWVKSLFSILPDTTETVVVMGPYKHVPIVPQFMPHGKTPDVGMPRKYDPIDFDTLKLKLPEDATSPAPASATPPQWTISQMAFQGNLHLFTCHPIFKPFVETQPFALSVWAFRPIEFKFEFPGGTRTEDCQLLVSQGAFPDSVVNLFRTAKKEIAGHAVVEGHIDDRPLDHPPGMVKVGEPGGPQVLVPEGVKLPEKKNPEGTLFFAMPTARLLIAANSETLLTSLLEEVSKPAAERAGFTYPVDLPGSPRIWGLRRFGAGYTQAGPTITTRAEYLMCLVDPLADRIEFRLKSTDPNLPADFSRAWQKYTNLELRVAPIGAGQIGGSITTADGSRWIYVIGILGILVLI